MRLDSKHIKKKEVVGILRGNPVHMVETTGGLHLIFAMHDGRYEPIGTGPHKAVAMWMAEKKEPALQWSALKKSRQQYTQEELSCIVSLSLAQMVLGSKE